VLRSVLYKNNVCHKTPNPQKNGSAANNKGCHNVEIDAELTHVPTQDCPPTNLHKLSKGHGSRGTEWVSDNSGTSSIRRQRQHREYTKYLHPYYRAGLSVMLIAPTFFVLTITFYKMYAVGIQAGQTVECYDGWVKATLEHVEGEPEHHHTAEA
jgi:hypothetical protein